MFRFKLVTTVLGDEVYFLGKILFFSHVVHVEKIPVQDLAYSYRLKHEQCNAKLSRF